MNRKKGFTLIELLVVIAIIALLLSIIMPALKKAKTYAEEVLCKTNLHQYALASEMYCNENDDSMPDPWQSRYDSCQGRCPGVCQVAGHQTFTGEAQRYCRWHNPDYNLQAYPEYGGPYWDYLAVTKANICPTFSKLAPKYGEDHLGSCIGGPFVPNFSYSMNTIFRHSVGNKINTELFCYAMVFFWVLNVVLRINNAEI